ncbi:MAG: 16S rRNA (uracil(1498)-N(3))-methyltransferase [Oscillospiraceae bacterium]|jgi:16S rRNA (uracil1498-N3)-methyltransferase|nr:16S rRNA (uracil(1498)-N(3))-methyltransferase [Oscillospiraceae bacterium]
MPRFFVNKSDITATEILLYDTAHIKALRLRAGDEFTVCDGCGTDYAVRLIESGGNAARAEILSASPSETEPSVALTVFLAFSKGERAEFAIQKCTELGASAFFLFPSERVVALPDKKSLANKLTRLNAVAKSAAEQSGRGIIPAVSACDSFESAAAAANAADLPLFFYENEQKQTLRDTFAAGPAPKSVSIMTGAEGGFSPAEAAFAAESGLRPVTLGPRILRCDTAPIAAAAAVMYITNNL